ncbi:RelA/SpoT family protein [Longimicrobium terrae]|uniref:RelA/SpoT family protein n=1 Tax=Longimicrobium terrae TaxID=1639882 RepID=UPI001472D5D6|nr:bifunctional (p)ppGpp synthetase/guanosine-3',5'-bis(diphosphate) 3'-pyrophosphohydrolase [Longimicrobium terrae]NNC33236.1 bifunctional (p)ppGpp synthetase/guanosine-3',5'-bis(diphosphate) 3'-pyrophosphohydrolase [Longimicrobium terrae]
MPRVPVRRAPRAPCRRRAADGVAGPPAPRRRTGAGARPRHPSAGAVFGGGAVRRPAGPGPDLARAYEFSSVAHAGQKRHSGEDYIVHCIEVARILADLHLDSATIAGGLIHDVVEDTSATLDDVRAAFGPEVATVVDGLTKIAKVQFRTSTEQQVENFRKLLLSMAQDARVILIKLADRLHNMRTLDYLREEKQHRIALETRDIYAPLAHRLGVAALKWELEDLCFKYLEPEPYRELARKVSEKRREREEWIENLRAPLSAELQESGINCDVTGRPKHLWSIYRKMVHREKNYDEIYDLMAVRVIVDTIADCYHALGVIHNRWTPLTERFHDYIATPKSNMYQSLHTTIFGPGGRLYEIQIRTRDMHRTAEYGIAAHWKYKDRDGGPRGDDVDETLTWFRQVLEWQQETREPEEFMEFLRIDLFQDEIFVFYPHGRRQAAAQGGPRPSTSPSRCTPRWAALRGRAVNGRITPITRELKNGDQVEVMTDAKQRPSRDWLAFVKTARARNKIRQWIKEEEFGDSVRLGREFIEREIRKARRDKVSDDRFSVAARTLDQPDADHLFAALGRGDLGPSAVMRALWPETAEEQQKAPSAFERLVSRVRREPNAAVRIQGMSNLMVRYSQCCQPVPGDKVVGYVTRGRA